MDEVAATHVSSSAARRWLARLERRVLQAIALVFLVPATSFAVSMMEQVEDELTCTSSASATERAQLDAPLLPRPLSAADLRAYFADRPRTDEHERLRHLTAIATVAWWADRTNDQDLRTKLYLDIGVRSKATAARSQARVFRQVQRCASVRLVTSAIEQNDPPIADRLAIDLAQRYRVATDEPAVEDWPLIIAIHELSLSAANTQGLQALVDAAAIRASGLEGTSPDRASRLDAAVARGLLAVGRPAEAYGAAALSIKLASSESKAAAAWRVFPTLHDGLVQTKGDGEAAALVAAFGEKFGTPPIDDTQADPATQIRLMKVAERAGKLDEANGRLRAAVANVFGLDRRPRSLPALRHALAELNTSDDEFAARERTDPAFARRSYAEVYRGMYDDLLAQSRSIFVADARDRMLFSSKIDCNLSAVATLQIAAPELRAEIADRSFRLAQLRSYGRLTLATIAAGLQSSTADENTRFHLERFFTMTTETSVWLRGLSNRLRVPLETQLPDGQRLWESVGTLDVFHHEMTGALPRSIEFVKTNAPQVGALITPQPSSPSEIQQQLGKGEVLIATIVTASNLYVWGIGRDEVAFARVPITRKRLFDLIRRLRKSLAPADESGRPQVHPFDADAAWELYRLLLEPVAPALAGATHLYWYGHEALGTIPPQVLLTGKPAHERMSDAAELSAAPFLTERYAITVLPDLSLFGRRGRAPAASTDTRFMGIGAPSRGAPAATMGARDRDFLAGLPQLPDADAELRRIATVVGDDRSTLWVGAGADETRFDGAALRDYSLISFATHGLSPGDLENLLEPALLLSLPASPQRRFDGLLTASEIARLPMRADLVILSACNTAASDGRPRGEALTGLGQAFLTAGARALMVSHWPVRSGAAAALSVGVVEGVRGGSPVAASLQQAIAKLRADRSNGDLEAHPSYWGPFVIVGG